MFAFLAGVRNYSGVTPIAKACGIPDDYQGSRGEYYCDLGDHSFSWLSIEELHAFNYEDMMEHRRVTDQMKLPGVGAIISGACTAEPGGGERMTWREFLGSAFSPTSQN